MELDKNITFMSFVQGILEQDFDNRYTIEQEAVEVLSQVIDQRLEEIQDDTDLVRVIREDKHLTKEHVEFVLKSAMGDENKEEEREIKQN